MAILLDLLTRAHLDPSTFGRIEEIDPFSRDTTVAAHVDLLSEVIWRLAFISGNTPMPRAGSEPGLTRQLLDAKRKLDRHWDHDVQRLAELARHAESVASDLRAAIEEAPIPF